MDTDTRNRMDTNGDHGYVALDAVMRTRSRYEDILHHMLHRYICHNNNNNSDDDDNIDNSNIDNSNTNNYYNNNTTTTTTTTELYRYIPALLN